MSGILVRSPGVHTTVQDLGRFGYQSLGVPPAGAADRDSLETANLLAGNPPGEACLECTLAGPELECAGPVVFSVCGAPMDVRVNGVSVPAWETVSAGDGDVISLGPASSGLRSYIAFAGGLAVEPKLGSRSTYLRAGFRGVLGRTLRAGDRLELGTPFPGSGGKGSPALQVPSESRPEYPSEILVRAVLSHEADRFESGATEKFFSESYKVSPKSDRMGLRLEGKRISHVRGADIISSGVQTGTVQVPGDGLPIVLLADRQTTGGYTRIAHVIQADLPKLGQARPGDTVRFLKTTVEEAQAAWRSREAALYGRIRPAVREIPPAGAGRPPDPPVGAIRRFRVTVCGRAYDVEIHDT